MKNKLNSEKLIEEKCILDASKYLKSWKNILNLEIIRPN
jgi:hypothetical protein